MKISLKVEGADAILKKFKKFGDEGTKVVADITEIYAKEIEADAKRNAPVDTGKLQQNIAAEKFNENTWYITAYERYATFVEFGTRFMASRPFLYLAFRGKSKTYVKDLNKALERLINKFNLK